MTNILQYRPDVLTNFSMGRMPETTALPQYNLFAQLKGIQDLLCISITGMLLQRFRVVIQLHMIASGQFLPRLYRIGLVVEQHISAVFLKKDVDDPLDQHSLRLREVRFQAAGIDAQHERLLPVQAAQALGSPHAPGQGGLQEILDFQYQKFENADNRYAWIIRKQFQGGFVKNGMKLAKKGRKNVCAWLIAYVGINFEIGDV